MFNKTKWIKLIMIQIAGYNGNTINDSNNTAFGKPSFFVTRDSYSYLPLDSDIIYKEGSRIYLGLFFM